MMIIILFINARLTNTEMLNSNNINEINNNYYDSVKNIYKSSNDIVQSSIINENNQIISTITNKEQQLYELLNENCSNPQNELAEIKIFSVEAQNRNIELSEEEKKSIINVSNAITEKVKLENSQSIELQENIEEYLSNVQYNLKLKEKILEEISTNQLSLPDSSLQKLVDEYQLLQEEAKGLTDAESKNEQFVKIYAKLTEIQDLYYQKILEQYSIDLSIK